MPERLPRTEFIALMAMLFATIAFSIDFMLPALPEIAADLTPEAPNRAQLILTSFVLGMGVGTLFTGPLSDAFGRRPVIIGGALLYILASLVAWGSASLELMLAARVAQGLGAAGPRVVCLAIIRDLYEGRRMAQMMSFIMLIFALVPALAPAMGAGIIALFDWRMIFGAFVLFSTISTIWLALRQAETHPSERRRPFRITTLWSGVAEVTTNRQALTIIVILSLTFGMLFGVLSSIQPIFDQTFGRGAQFHLWFALIAVVAAMGNILNARIVMAMGMRRVALLTYMTQIGISGVFVLVTALGMPHDLFAFGLFVFWACGVFTMLGLTIGNLNALAMEPLGHIAGMAASIIGAISTVSALVIAIPVGLAFDGTPLPIALGVLACSILACLLTLSLGEGAPEPITKTT